MDKKKTRQAFTVPKNQFETRLRKEVEVIKKKVSGLYGKGEPEFLIAMKFPNNDIHTHFPGNEEISTDIVASILRQKGIDLNPANQVDNTEDEEPKRNELLFKSFDTNAERKIIFKHSRALGDGLMFTAGIRDFKLLFPHIRINVDSNQSMLWENNPYIDRSIKKEDPGVEYYYVGYPLGDVNTSHRHFAGMFFMDMVAQVDEHKPLYTEDGKKFPLWQFCAAYANGNVGDPSMSDSKKNPRAREPFISIREKYKKLGASGFCQQRGDIHLSEEEKQDNLIKKVYNVDKYWVVAPGGKRDCTSKIWDWRRMQEIVNYFDGKIKFVVIGRSDHLVEKLNNVIDLTDKFNKDVRGLVPLVYHAEGCVSGPSFLNHLAASVSPKNAKSRKPCVVIWGGREPSSWCYYTNHQMLHTNGVFSCCDNGGCWTARTIPMQKDPKHNKNLCKHTVNSENRTIQSCMHVITTQDVIRGIEKYYDGDLYIYGNFKKARESVKEAVSGAKEFKVMVYPTVKNNGKQINLLGNLNTSGGGEQSLVKIAEVLDKSGWKVNLYPWGIVHDNFKGNKFLVNEPFKLEHEHFRHGPMQDKMEHGLPLLFYGNDCVWDFPKFANKVVEQSSSVVIGINYCLGDIKKCDWLASSGKLKGIVFQNSEKMEEFKRQSFGFNGTKYIHYVGAIDLDSMLEVCPKQREKDEELVILKHGKPDKRKYVTEETKNKGDKVHVWQKNFAKEADTKFYSRLLKDTKKTRFEFMVAPKELEDHFKGEKRMVFHSWNAMSVTEFLARGHIYLDRLSNEWRHNYPRTVGEALAAGLPVICEPRDGQKDRVSYGDTGIYCLDYDEFREAIRKFQRKEGWRHQCGMYAKDWARENLRPEKWVDIIEELVL